MLFAIIVPYSLGGLAGPSLQSLVTSQVPANEQGELQGGIQSVMSLTSIVGPLVMSNVFFFYTRPEGLYFPGAPYVLGAFLALVSLAIAYRTLRSTH
jgi:DHA1 family tetracycline resistance protein-like MFS transporter